MTADHIVIILAVTAALFALFCSVMAGMRTKIDWSKAPNGWPREPRTGDMFRYDGYVWEVVRVTALGEVVAMIIDDDPTAE